jgi:hypothetical protein
LPITPDFRASQAPRQAVTADDPEPPISARQIAAVLEIAAPDDATADELSQWISWWKPSYETARRLSQEQKDYLKSGGWWPPLVASQIDTSAPAIVRRTLRPEIFSC